MTLSLAVSLFGLACALFAVGGTIHTGGLHRRSLRREMIAIEARFKLELALAAFDHDAAVTAVLEWQGELEEERRRQEELRFWQLPPKVGDPWR